MIAAMAPTGMAIIEPRMRSSNGPGIQANSVFMSATLSPSIAGRKFCGFAGEIAMRTDEKSGGACEDCRRR